MDRAQLAPRQSGRAGLDLDAADGAIHIELDPGLAFGTGSHPTTHLCLAWLEAELPAGATLLDYGCGSGILAIAARKLGAGPTQAVDIDPQAVQSTVFNAQVNGVELDAMLPDGLKDGTFQVVVANILSNPLKVLAPMLAGRVAPGGQLVPRACWNGRPRKSPPPMRRGSPCRSGARATAGSACTAARPERIAAAQRHGFDHPLPALRHRLQGGAGPVADPQWPGALRRLLLGVRRPGQSGAARGRSRAAGRDAGRHAGRDCGPAAEPAHAVPPLVRPETPTARASEPVPPWEDEPAFSQSPARPWAQPPSTTPPAVLRSREQIRRQAQDQDARADELDDDELLDDELHDDESQDDEPRGGRRHGEDGHDDASGWRDRADERYPHSRPRRHDSRSVAARRS